MGRGGRAAIRVGAVVVVALAAVLALWLGAAERGGPPHTAVFPADGIPATLYLPDDGTDVDPGALPYPAAAGERPPVVVIAHGYSADQAVMSPFARSLAEAGYATITFDFRGHGSNSDRFGGDLTDDVAEVVDWAQRSPYVDGDRIAVLGHSMGASAVLDFATLDPRPRAVVPVSGGNVAYDAVVPDHVLLLVASGDPGRIHDRQADVAADLSARGAEVASVEIGGRDHLTILFSSDAVKAVVDFLDPVMGIDRDGPTPGLHDDRLVPAALYALVAVLLFGLIGLLAGGFAPAGAPAGAPGGLLLVAGALVATLPVMAVGGIGILPLGAGQPLAVQFGLAGALLWTLRALAGREALPGAVVGWLPQGDWLPLRRVLAVGAAAAGLVFLALLPLGGLVHRLVPTPDRLVFWVLLALLQVPFFAAFEAVVRRGSVWQSLGWGLLGRAVLVVVLVVGLALGWLPSVLGLVVPMVVGLFVIFELFAACCYARCRNPAVIAVTESIVLAWIAVMLSPVG